MSGELCPAGPVECISNPVEGPYRGEDRLWHEIDIWSSAFYMRMGRQTGKSQVAVAVLGATPDHAMPHPEWDFFVQSEEDAVLLGLAW